MAFSINTIYNQIFKIWRQRRFTLFVKLLSPRLNQRLIDIGGYPSFWPRQPLILKSIDILNIHSVLWDTNAFPEYHIQTLLGDGCALQFPDKCYDIAYSNSVIEHVGDWSKQQAFAREIRRVGKAIWLQTPAFSCPIEPHYLALFIHWLPKSIQRKILRWLTPWGWIAKPSLEAINQAVDTTRLLKKHEVQQLFPDCEIHTEYLLGFIPKSYIAIRKNAECA